MIGVAYYNNGKEEGPWKGYYENGVVATERFYREGKKVDTWVDYYENGIPAIRNYYNSDLLDSIIAYYPSGEMEKKIIFEESGIESITMFFKTGDIFFQLIFRNGRPHRLARLEDFFGSPLDGGDFAEGNGMLISYYSPYDFDGSLAFIVRSQVQYTDGVAENDAQLLDRKEQFFPFATPPPDPVKRTSQRNKKHTEGKLPDPNSTTKDSTRNAPVGFTFFSDFFSSQGEMPEFPGGDDMLSRYVASMDYPDNAVYLDIEGSVYVRCVIDELGEIVEVEIVNASDPLLEATCLEHFKRMPRWIPGTAMGLPAKVQCLFPIEFKLY